MHVKSAARFTSETIVGALVVRLVRANRHGLLWYGKAGDMGVLGCLLDNLLAFLLVVLARSERGVHLLGHEHGERGEAVFVRHGQPRLTHALLRVVFVHRVDGGPHSCHLLANLSSRHLTVSIAYHKARL